ncbi:hypothetical protein CmeUKMEL1_17165 [Cryptosporidium meleagridis]|uniref:Macro domain-containing protein n=1 Tax=Cryptosporidium meleagridis TaxID=93969 RepID=A0A2P4Z5N9_9CRYT|nr:hypothetical protein CmeUKMEL1_17165 [Cryptosporidium meleagridis]
MNYLILFTLLSQLIAAVYSFDCTSTSTLDNYLVNRGGSLNSAKCISVVLLDVNSPSILSSTLCDALVVDSKNADSAGLLDSARVTCPATASNFPVVFDLNPNLSRRARLGSIYCVESSIPESVLYSKILNRALADQVSNILLPVVTPGSTSFESRINNAAFQVRSWIMTAFGSNNMKCPFNIIIPAADFYTYNEVLHGFSKAFTRNQAAYIQSIQSAPTSTPTPTPAPTPVPLPRTQLLSDFNQYDGIACPTMKNFFTLLSEVNDPYINKYTSVTTQISLAFSDFTMGIHSCDAFIMESGTYKFEELMKEMGLPYSPITQESGITVRSTNYRQSPAVWYSSLKKVMYLDFYKVIHEVDTYESLMDLIKTTYLHILEFADKNRLFELLILPFGLWDSRHSYSIQIITAAVEGLAAALNEFLLYNSQMHITILTETREKFEVLVDQIKPHFMNVRTSEELLGTGTTTQIPPPVPVRPPPRPSRPPPRPSRPPPPVPQRPIGPLRPITSQQPPIGQSTQGTYYFDSDEECMSGTPVSEFIQSMYNGRISQPTTSNHFSLILSRSNPGVIGCGCLVVDASDKAQLELAVKLGISAKECTSVGSSEIKVLGVRALNAYTIEPWMTNISRVYCLNSTKFIYNSRVKAVETLYKKILASAKYRCNTVLSPLIATSMATSESRNKDYILQAVKSMDEFFSTSPHRDSIHLTFYEGNPEIFFLALDLFATYYLEYASSGGVSATLTSINRNWISLNEIIGNHIIPQFRAPTPQKKPKTFLGSVKREISRRIRATTTTTTTPRPTKIPPPRPPLPKFTGNKDADRPAPSSSVFTSSHYQSLEEFTRQHSKSDVEGLYSMNYWVQQLSTFTSTSLVELSKRFYLTNVDITDLSNCKVLAVDALSPGIHNILSLIGHSYPSLLGRVTVLANRRYGDNTVPLTKKLNRLYIVDADNGSPSAFEEMISKAVASSEKQLVLGIFYLKEMYGISRRHAEQHILHAIQALINKMKQYTSSSLKVVIVEENPVLASIILEVLVSVFSGRTRI